MPNLTLTSSPINSFVSVYHPIKYSARVNVTDVAKYPSCLVTITPQNTITDLNEPSVQIRVQAQPNAPSNIDPTAYAATGTSNYPVDVSSICRDFVSFDIRPCTHDTTDAIKRDMTQGSMSLNTFKFFTVKFELEKIDSSGALVIDADTDSAESSFTAINATLSNEEQHASYVDNELHSPSISSNSFASGEFFRRYLHSQNSNRNRLCKYLTVKPTSKRYIGEDESEYLSMLVQRDEDDNFPYLQVRFCDLSGNQIQNTFINLESIAVGDGTYSSSTLEHGVQGVTKETKAVVQFGVGTRNIKETMTGLFGVDDGIAPLVGDFRYISKYEIRSHFTSSSSDPQIGETVTYHINHNTTNIGETRFHWQNRLGGIDSYTFEDTMIKSLMTSSSTFEQTIYPKFTDQLGKSSNDNDMFSVAVEDRTGGITSDEYHSVAKSNIKSYRNGQAVSRPLSSSEIPMMEDLLSSPRVWIEGGWIGDEIFRDNFDVAPTSTDWVLVDGSFDEISISSVDDAIATNSNLVYGDNSGDDELWLVSKKLFPYDPNKIYEVEIRTKRSGSAGCFTLCGLVGYKSDKTTVVSKTGADTFSDPHMITLDSYDQVSDDEWETHRGYITGKAISGTVGEQSNDVNNPAFAHQSVAFFAPFFALAHDNDNEISQVDYIKVTEYESDLPNSERWYSSLNRHYYIPVVIKDSQTTMFDSNNVQKITLDYMHSKEQKTLK